MRIVVRGLTAILLTANFIAAQDGVINTLAGGGSDAGENVPASTAILQSPVGLAFGPGATDLYVAESDGGRVRRISGGGVVSTVPGATGFVAPAGIALDDSGNLFVADQFGYRIWKIQPDGTKSAVAGTGTSAFSGDGGQAIDGQLFEPYGLAVDASGSVYFTDGGRVRKVDPNGILTTILGGGAPPCQETTVVADLCLGAKGLAVGPDGSLYVVGAMYTASGVSGRVSRITGSTAVTVAGRSGGAYFCGDGGLAVDACLESGVYQIALDQAGDLFVADRGNLRVRRIDTNGIITTIAGNGDYGFSGDGGPATSAMISNPLGMAVSGANLYFADRTNNRIRWVQGAGQPLARPQ